MKESDSKRARRLADTIMRELADIIAIETQDPRLELVTVLDVSLDQAMNVATVRYAVHADADQAAQGLAHSRGFLRTELGKRFATRRVPELVFQFDDAAGTPDEGADSFEEMLHAARRG
ncbi:MAG: 30S ribosome-binding factor RbfA [Oceanidesulfovibrio sp.]